MAKTILIVEDEVLQRETLAELLAEEGYHVLQAGDGKAAYEVVRSQAVDLVLSDVRMPEMDGMVLLQEFGQIAPEVPIILVTAYGTVQSAVAAIKAGASDYVLKPVQFDEVLLKIRRALDYGQMARTRQVMVEQLAAGSVFHSLVGQAPAMIRLIETVRRLSAIKSNVLILGESGTGKELIAKAIHYNGITRDQPFIPVNCGGIPESLVESELFGYRRGAFTGANRDKVGYFQAADGGTLFLDEISALPLSMQSSLLRALEDRAIVPVGDTRSRPVDVRIIAASNRDLGKMVAQEQFREDLYYRLNVVKLQLPPLRQRRQDIPLLAQHFIEKYSRQMNKDVRGATDAAMQALLGHEWRGNVRELENVIEHAVIFADGEQIALAHLPFVAEPAAEETAESLKDALRQVERQRIISSLRRHNNDKVATARDLGIGLSSLYRKLDDLNIPKNPEDADTSQEPAS